MLVMKAIMVLETIQILRWKNIDDENVSNTLYLHKNEKVRVNILNM